MSLSKAVTALFCLCSTSVSAYSSDFSTPNVMIIVADDLGWNDVGYHGASNIETPNIDALASDALRLESHYVLPLCSPTRAALLTGRYPTRLGIQSAVFKGSDTYGLSLLQPTLAESLHDGFGYSTHMVGKWHLGYAAWQYTPTYRGFDTFFGFYLGEQDKWSHVYSKNGYEGVDLRDGTQRADMDVYDNYYSAWLEGNQTLKLLQEVVNKDVSTDPFFMYLAYSTPHKPVEAPDYVISKYEEVVASEDRQTYSAMVDILDDVIGNVVNELKQLDMWDNTLIVFMSDNGGERSIGDNFPLCGNKNMLYEGGTRSPSFVTGGYLQESMRGKVISNEIVHVTDWYATILSILNENYVTEQNNELGEKSESMDDAYFGEIDGINQWPFLNDENNDESLRSEFIYNIDPNLCVASDGGDKVCGAIRSGKYKYILANRNDVTSWNTVWKTGKPSVECGDAAKSVSRSDIASDRCEGNLVTDGCLFDLESDPCELTDLSDDLPDVASELFDKLVDYYNNEMNTPLENFYSSDYDSSDPSNDANEGFWQPWIDLDDYENQENPYKRTVLSAKASKPVHANGQRSFFNLNEIASAFGNVNLVYIVGMAATVVICGGFAVLSCVRSRRRENSEEVVEEFSPLLYQRKDRTIL